jgi:hypothetical protein
MNNSVLTFLANTSAVGGSGETAKKKSPASALTLQSQLASCNILLLISVSTYAFQLLHVFNMLP